MAKDSVAGFDCSAAQREKLRHQLVHLLLRRHFDAQAQLGGIAIGAAYRELLDFEPASGFDNRIEDLLHDVGINEMALGFDDFGNGRPLRPGNVRHRHGCVRKSGKPSLLT